MRPFPRARQNLVLGAVSGMAAAIIMTPVDVVKTRLMTGSATGGIVGVMQARRPPRPRLIPRTLRRGVAPSSPRVHPPGPPARTPRVCSRERSPRASARRARPQAIIRDEGAATLMKGVVPRVAFLAPLAALTLGLYDTFGKQLVSQRTGVAVAELVG